MVWKDMQKWFEDPETFYDDVENWWKDFYGEVDTLATSIGDQFEYWWWQLNREGRKVDDAISEWFEKDIVGWFEGPVKDFLEGPVVDVVRDVTNFFEGPVADAVDDVGKFFHNLFNFGRRKKRAVSSVPSPNPFPRFRRGLRNLFGRLKRPRTNPRPRTASRPNGRSGSSNPRAGCNCPCRRRKPTPVPTQPPLATTPLPNSQSQPFDSQSQFYNPQSRPSNRRHQNSRHSSQRRGGVSKLTNYCNHLPHITVLLNRPPSQPQLHQSITTPVLLDTGSSVSLISLELATYLGLIINPSRLAIQGIGGEQEVEGVSLVSVTLGQPPHSKTIGVQVYVIPSEAAGNHLLLGVNFLGAVGKITFEFLPRRVSFWVATQVETFPFLSGGTELPEDDSMDVYHRLPKLRKRNPSQCSYRVEVIPVSGRPVLLLPYDAAFKALAHLLPLSEGLPLVWELGEAFGDLIREFPSPDGWDWSTTYHCLTAFSIYACLHNCVGCMRRRAVMAQEKSATLIKRERRWDWAYHNQPHLPCKVDPGYCATVLPAHIPDTFWGRWAHLGQGGRYDEDPYRYLIDYYPQCTFWHTPDQRRYESRGLPMAYYPEVPVAHYWPFLWNRPEEEGFFLLLQALDGLLSELEEAWALRDEWRIYRAGNINLVESQLYPHSILTVLPGLHFPMFPPRDEEISEEEYECWIRSVEEYEEEAARYTGRTCEWGFLQRTLNRMDHRRYISAYDVKRRYGRPDPVTLQRYGMIRRDRHRQKSKKEGWKLNPYPHLPPIY